MQSGKLVRFIERWRDLEKRRKDLDFDRAVFARDLRAEFGSDAEFIRWCGLEIGLGEIAARDLLTLGTAAKVVPDATVWRRVGGSREIRAVAVLPRREQVEVIETAKATGKAIRTLVRERTNAPEPEVRSSPTADAQALAHFVLETVPQARLTPKIKAVLSRYVNLPSATLRTVA